MNEYRRLMGQMIRTHRQMLRAQQFLGKRLQTLLKDSEVYLEAVGEYLIRKLPKKTASSYSWVDSVLIWLNESVPFRDKQLPVWHDPIVPEKWVGYLLLKGRLETPPVGYERLKKLFAGKFQTAQQALPEIEALFEPWSEWVEVTAEEIPGQVYVAAESVNVEVKPGIWRQKKRYAVRQDPPMYRLVLALKKAPVLPKPK